MVFVLQLREKRNNQINKQIKQSLNRLKDLSKNKTKTTTTKKNSYKILFI